jgi:DNA-binding PadR family transcriptional regulator
MTQWNVKSIDDLTGGAVTTRINPTAASLLGFLHSGPMTGWDLMVTAERVIGDFWSLTQSQVYRELAAMSDSGLIEQGERGVRDRKPYTITDAGRLAFADWIDREPAPETIRFPLLLTVAFGGHLPPDRLAAFLATHRASHQRRLTGYLEVQAATGESAGMAAYARATLDFGIAYERAVLAWFDGLPAQLTDSEAAGEP